MNVKATVIRLTVSMIERIEKVAGKHRMSQFAREAIEAELVRREASAATHDKPKPKPKSPTKPKRVRK